MLFPFRINKARWHSWCTGKSGRPARRVSRSLRRRQKINPIGWWFKPWIFLGMVSLRDRISRGWKWWPPRKLGDGKGHGLNHLVGGFLCWVPIFLLFKGTLAAPPRNRFVDLKVKASLYVRNSLIVSSKPPPIHGAPPEQLSKGQGPLVGPGGVVGDEIRAPIIW